MRDSQKFVSHLTGIDVEMYYLLITLIWMSENVRFPISGTNFPRLEYIFGILKCSIIEKLCWLVKYMQMGFLVEGIVIWKPYIFRCLCQKLLETAVQVFGWDYTCFQTQMPSNIMTKLLISCFFQVWSLLGWIMCSLWYVE